MTSGPLLITLDDRGRAALSKLATHNRYFATVGDDGSILLTPAVVMTPVELDAAIQAARTSPERLVKRGRLKRHD